ncbi:hypothetical protein BB561_002865 [Smittium simulii]|uniref:AMP-dependent synthetase/ligase domain-containing protein n=1 Tax=Smittium simulii TaxID=133385 RepID=A0A2T9YNT2_9FUNG|nr:hypothetical protein BB561_002865 [Smittium simulii]
MYFKSPIPDQPIPALDVATYILEEGKRQAKKQGSSLSYALYDEDTSQSLSIFEFEKLSIKLASGLSHNHQIKPGDVALIFSSNCINYTIAIFAILMAGSPMSLANPSFKPQELAIQINDANPKLIFTKEEFLPTVLQAIELSNFDFLSTNIILLDSYSKNTHYLSVNQTYSSLEFKRFTISDLETAKKTVAFLPASSGTTGFPKGVMLSHHNIVANTIQISVPSKLNGWFNSSPGIPNRFLAVLPYYHIYGLVIITCIGLANNIGIVSLSKFELKKYLETVQKHKITFAHMVPPMIIRLNDPVVDTYDFSSVKYIMTAASQLSTEVADKIKKKFGVSIAQIYGTTETSPAVTVSDRNSDMLNSKGVLTCNVIAKIIDDSGNLLGPNKAGEMCFKGPNIMNGYLNNHKATAETIDSDGFLHTGDIGYIDENGQLYLIERKKELIKFKGFQVAPAELESTLLGHPDVFEAIVIGVDNYEQQTEVPKAYISLKSNTANFTGAQKNTKALEIMSWFDEKVAPHKKLRGGIVITDEIPKTLSGKLLRRHIREIDSKSQIKTIKSKI